MIVEKSGECPFDTVAACHGEVDARFIVLRSTCLTAQNLVKNRGDKRWFADHGVVMSTLVTAKEVVHDISRFLYREVMTPREKVAEMISAYQKELRWSDSFMVGVHIRTGSVNKERVKWGRFLDEKDVRLFKRYVTELTEAYESGKNVLQLGRKDDFYAALVQKKQEMKLPVKWYVLSDQDGIRTEFEKEYPEYVVGTKCEMSHTNQALSKKDDPGFMCALVESYLLSSTDVMVLTKRSTYGNLARHRTHAPFVTVDKGDYEKWKKSGKDKQSDIPLEFWDVSDM